MTFFQHIRKLMMTRLLVNDDKFSPLSSLTEPTSSQKEKTTGNCNLIIMKPVDTC